MGWVDLHTHIVFDVDDGVADLTQALAVVAELKALGFSEICATPHQKAHQYLPAWDLVTTRFSELVAALPPNDPILHLGAENMWDEVFHQRYQHGAIPCYGGGNAFLFELPHATWPPAVLETVFGARMRGQLPVLAHPERYRELAGNRTLAVQVAAQCAMVVDAAALVGHHGATAMNAARWLFQEDLVHALASDSHRALDVAQAAEGIDWVAKHYGAATVDRLLGDAPRAILQGDHPG